jgi:hypothetical protein
LLRSLKSAYQREFPTFEKLETLERLKPTT